ncbi:extracellular solute-binding protein [Paenibacillus oceani]|uniref:Extracellular solute-binding protein n=1 Tax=Paenibacillus oceani TaxID=2772510 RepID=A0A927CDA1_9BACL|nr:extracellular solute-binding protein [Paenibacillus oceani]MBD2865344.1 extracellular solute-binding protein [Paenibacillus oceani]
MAKEKASRKTFRSRLQGMIDQLRTQITEGHYELGDYLPAESALAEQYMLSNNSVRKGLDVLVGEGFIVKVDKVGSRVVKGVKRKQTVVSVGCTPSISRDLVFERLIDDFQSLHPSIRVKPVTGTAERPFANSTYIEAIRAHMEADEIDVFTINTMSFNELAESGYTGLLEPQKASGDMYPFLNAAYSIDDVLYAQPLIFSPVVLCYNRTHFREAGLPEPDSSWRWSDLVRAAARLTTPNQKHGFYFFQVSENRWPLFLLQSGESFEWDGDRLRSIRGTKLMEGVRLCGELTRNRDIFPNYVSESSTDESRLFLEGKISMLLAPYNSLNDFKHTDLDYDISPVPFLDRPATLMFTVGVMVNRQSGRKAAAQTFVDYLASARAQEIIRRESLSIPAIKAIAEETDFSDSGLNRPKHYALFREIIPSYRVHAELNIPVRVFKQLPHLLKLFWSELMDEETLDERLSALVGGTTGE